MNDDNLIKFTEKTARDFGARGAAVANRKKREKKTMQALLQTLLEARLTDEELRSKIKEAGIKDADVTNGMAMLYAMFKSALGGSSKAFSALMELLGNEKATGKNSEAPLDSKVTIEFVDNSEKNKENGNEAECIRTVPPAL